MKYKFRRFLLLLVNIVVVWLVFQGITHADEIRQNYVFVPGLRMLETGERVYNQFRLVPDEYDNALCIIFSADCDACRKYLEMVQSEIWEKSSSIYVIGMSYNDSKASVQRLVKKLDLTFPILTGVKELPPTAEGIPYSWFAYRSDVDGEWYYHDEADYWTGAAIPSAVYDLIDAEDS